MSIKVIGIDKAPSCDKCEFCLLSSMDGSANGIVTFFCFFNREKPLVREGRLDEVRKSMDGHVSPDCPVRQTRPHKGPRKVSIPEGTGDLIDRDALKESLKGKFGLVVATIADGTVIGTGRCPSEMFFGDIDRAPAIVEADI